MSTEQISNVTIAGQDGPVDIAWADGVITAVTPTADHEGGFGGAFAFPGFVDAHIHLDKAHILDRTMGGDGGLSEAIGKVREAKRGFTIDDVQERASRVLDSAIVHGTTMMRSFVEVDPDAGLRSFDALAELKASYADRIDLQLSAFAQDGTTQTPETVALLGKALAAGAGQVGGCPYTDTDPQAHIRAILDLAHEFDVPADFHVDFDLDPSWDHLTLILDAVERRGLEGRVGVGHATKLSAFEPERRAQLARRMADLGIALVVLPATDLFLPGRDIDVLKPRSVAPPLAGVTTAVATNNVCNPFTPYGDADLLRMANLYATVNQLGTDAEVEGAWRTVTTSAETAVGIAHRALTVGSPATLVVLDAPDPVTALRELRQPLAGWRAGRPTFTRPRPTLL